MSYTVEKRLVSSPELYTCGVCLLVVDDVELHDHLSTHSTICTKYIIDSDTRMVVPETQLTSETQMNPESQMMSETQQIAETQLTSETQQIAETQLTSETALEAHTDFPEYTSTIIPHADIHNYVEQNSLHSTLYAAFKPEQTHKQAGLLRDVLNPPVYDHGGDEAILSSRGSEKKPAGDNNGMSSQKIQEESSKVKLSKSLFKLGSGAVKNLSAAKSVKLGETQWSKEVDVEKSVVHELGEKSVVHELGDKSVVYELGDKPVVHELGEDCSFVSDIPYDGRPLNVGEIMTVFQIPYIQGNKTLGKYECTVIVTKFISSAESKTKKRSFSVWYGPGESNENNGQDENETGFMATVLDHGETSEEQSDYTAVPGVKKRSKKQKSFDDVPLPKRKRPRKGIRKEGRKGAYLPNTNIRRLGLTKHGYDFKGNILGDGFQNELKKAMLPKMANEPGMAEYLGVAEDELRLYQEPLAKQSATEEVRMEFELETGGVKEKSKSDQLKTSIQNCKNETRINTDQAADMEHAEENLCNMQTNFQDCQDSDILGKVANIRYRNETQLEQNETRENTGHETDRECSHSNGVQVDCDNEYYSVTQCNIQKVKKCWASHSICQSTSSFNPGTDTDMDLNAKENLNVKTQNSNVNMGEGSLIVQDVNIVETSRTVSDIVKEAADIFHSNKDESGGYHDDAGVNSDTEKSLKKIDCLQKKASESRVDMDTSLIDSCSVESNNDTTGGLEPERSDDLQTDFKTSCRTKPDGTPLSDAESDETIQHGGNESTDHAVLERDHCYFQRKDPEVSESNTVRAATGKERPASSQSEDVKVNESIANIPVASSNVSTVLTPPFINYIQPVMTPSGLVMPFSLAPVPSDDHTQFYCIECQCVLPKRTKYVDHINLHTSVNELLQSHPLSREVKQATAIELVKRVVSSENLSPFDVSKRKRKGNTTTPKEKYPKSTIKESVKRVVIDMINSSSNGAVIVNAVTGKRVFFTKSGANSISIASGDSSNIFTSIGSSSVADNITKDDSIVDNAGEQNEMDETKATSAISNTKQETIGFVNGNTEKQDVIQLNESLDKLYPHVTATDQSSNCPEVVKELPSDRSKISQIDVNAHSLDMAGLVSMNKDVENLDNSLAAGKTLDAIDREETVLSEGKCPKQALGEMECKGPKGLKQDLGDTDTCGRVLDNTASLTAHVKSHYEIREVVNEGEIATNHSDKDNSGADGRIEDICTGLGNDEGADDRISNTDKTEIIHTPKDDREDVSNANDTADRKDGRENVSKEIDTTDRKTSGCEGDSLEHRISGENLSVVDIDANSDDNIEVIDEYSDGDNLLTCDLCGDIVESRKLLIKHIKTHPEDQVYLHYLRKHVCSVCLRCGRSFYQEIDLRCHLKSQDCSARALFLTALDENFEKDSVHVEGDTGDKVLQHDVDAFDKGVRSLRRKTVAKRTVKRVLKQMYPEIEDDDKRFHCKWCRRPYDSDHELLIHQCRCHFKPKEKCSQCDFESSAFSTLSRHYLDAHNVKKRHECDKCEKSFLTAREVRIHTEAEHENKMYICEHCGKTFKFRKYLMRHNVLNHQKSYFQCSYCRFKCLTANGLTLHEKKHKGDYDNFCVPCEKVFPGNSNYIQHMSQIHKMAKKEANMILAEAIRVRGTLCKHKCLTCNEIFPLENAYYIHMASVHSVSQEEAEQIIQDRIRQIEKEREAASSENKMGSKQGVSQLHKHGVFQEDYEMETEDTGDKVRVEPSLLTLI